MQHGRKQAGPDIGGLLAFRVSFLRSVVRRRFELGPTGPALALGEPEAIAVHFEDMDVMRETIEERAVKNAERQRRSSHRRGWCAC